MEIGPVRVRLADDASYIEGDLGGPRSAWRDDKFPAELNGVRFHVESTRKRGGRRTAAHEFADVDEAYVEDSAAAPQRHEVTAFLLGDDYHVVRQRLEDVLELGGPLELHHPTAGSSRTCASRAST